MKYEAILQSKKTTQRGFIIYQESTARSSTKAQGTTWLHQSEPFKVAYPKKKKLHLHTTSI
jgi:hypothetical protein